MSTLASILGLSFVSGINLYLGVLVTGLAQRLGLVTGLPPELQLLAHTPVLIAAGLCFLLESFADKVPFITPLWDFVHTFIRPVGGALLALGAAGRLSPEAQVFATLAGGAIALGVHGTKMGVRLAAHVVPDPGTHATLSVAEDTGVVLLLALVWRHPNLALAVIGALLLIMVLLLPRLLRTLDFMFSAMAGRILSWYSAGGPATLAPWAEEAILGLDPDGSGLVLPTYAWSVKGAPKLMRGYLLHSHSEWHFICRRWFRTRVIHILTDRPEAITMERGLVYDTVNFRITPWIARIFLTKEWGMKL